MSESKLPNLFDLKTFRFICERIKNGRRVSYRSLARASRIYTSSSLNRAVLRLQQHYQRTLLSTREDGGLAITEEGLRLYEVARQMQQLLQRSYGVEELRVRVADAVFAEIFPAALAIFLQRWLGKVKLIFQKINYATIREELTLSQSLPGHAQLGVGWDLLPDTETAWAHKLRPAIPSVVIAPTDRARFTQGQELTTVHQGLLPRQVLFVLNQDQRSPALEPFLDGIEETMIVDCPNYNSILNLVRSKGGAAVIPHWPWILDRLRTKEDGGIRYAFLPAAASQHVTCYVPPVGTTREEVRDLILAVEESLKERYPGQAEPPLSEETEVTLGELATEIETLPEQPPTTPPQRPVPKPLLPPSGASDTRVS